MTLCHCPCPQMYGKNRCNSAVCGVGSIGGSCRSVVSNSSISQASNTEHKQVPTHPKTKTLKRGDTIATDFLVRELLRNREFYFLCIRGTWKNPVQNLILFGRWASNKNSTFPITNEIVDEGNGGFLILFKVPTVLIENHFSRLWKRWHQKKFLKERKCYKKLALITTDHASHVRQLD